jgi:MFS family permease
LVHRGLTDRALVVLGQTLANGDTSAPVVRETYDEIAETLRREQEEGQKLTLKECVRTPLARKRILLACSAALFSTIAGNVIASYYLGAMLTNAGVTNTTTQLQINVVLNAFCLVCSLFGTWAIDAHGRKPTALISQGFLTLFLFLVGGLTKVYGTSDNHSGVYGTVACIFLFLGSYSYGWTPILYLYPPEVLNYSIRANGMGVFTFVLNAAAYVSFIRIPV